MNRYIPVCSPAHTRTSGRVTPYSCSGYLTASPGPRSKSVLSTAACTLPASSCLRKESNFSADARSQLAPTDHTRLNTNMLSRQLVESSSFTCGSNTRPHRVTPHEHSCDTASLIERWWVVAGCTDTKCGSATCNRERKCAPQTPWHTHRCFGSVGCPPLVQQAVQQLHEADDQVDVGSGHKLPAHSPVSTQQQLGVLRHIQRHARPQLHIVVDLPQLYWYCMIRTPAHAALLWSAPVALPAVCQAAAQAGGTECEAPTCSACGQTRCKGRPATQTAAAGARAAPG